MSAQILGVIQDGRLSGAANMARDEALLRAVGRGDLGPTLRLYEWSEPTISLGYFQPFAEFEALEPPARELAVVRRTTGGGAILHDQELTYCLVLPIEGQVLAGKPGRLYERVHGAIQSCLTELGVSARPCGVRDDSGAARGPFFCFARRHEADLLVGSEKIVGSAQRRTRQAVMQQGSIVLGGRFSQQPSAIVVDEDPSRLRERLAEAVAQALDMHARQQTWDVGLSADIDELQDKYAHREWTRRR